MKLKYIIYLHGRIKLKQIKTLIQKILRISDQSINENTEDQNKTTIYNQFQLKRIKTSIT